MRASESLVSDGLSTTSNPSDSKLVKIAVLVFATLTSIGIIIARRPQAVLHPELWAEDGIVWLHDAYTFGWWNSLWYVHASYLQLFPRVIADLSLPFPLTSTAAIFVWVAILVQASPVVVLLSSRGRQLVPSIVGRSAIALIYLNIPNASELNATLTNTQWHLALLAFLCLITVPRTLWGKLFDVAVLVMVCLTGPFGPILFVVSSLWLIHQRRAASLERWTSISWLSTGVLSIAQGIIVLAHLGERPIGQLGASFHSFVNMIGGQIGIGALVGANGLAWVDRHSFEWDLKLVAFLALGLVALLALVKGPIALRLLWIYAGAVLLGSLIEPLAPAGSPAWVVAGMPGADTRYWFSPVLAVLITLLWGVCSGAKRILKLDSWRSYLPILGGALCALGLLFTLVIGLKSFWKYPNLPSVGYRSAVARFERTQIGVTVSIPEEPPSWVFTLSKVRGRGLQ